MTAPFVPHAGARDPARLLDHTLQSWGGRGDVWVFGYASLIWRPEFEAVEERPATVHGWHRALAMRSRINRGTPERPGLVFALVPGGSCRGARRTASRSRASSAELDRLWAREMPTGVYDPKWLAVPHPARHRPRPRLHAQPAQPEPHRAARRRRAARDPAAQRTAATARTLDVPGRDRAVAAHLRHPRSRRSNGSSRWRAVTR